MAEGAAVSYLLRKLADPLVEKALELYLVSEEIKQMQQELASIQAYLKDADSQRKRNNSVKEWVNQIRDIAYRMEDVIDTFLVEIEENSPKSHRWLSNVTRVVKNPKKMNKLGDELKSIRKNLNDIFQLQTKLKIMDPDAGSEENPCLTFRRTLHTDDADDVGLEVDKRKIIDQLLDRSISRRMVLSIVGPGGLGKTTLAQKIFESAKLTGIFDCLTWLSISQKFNLNDLLRKILHSIEPMRQQNPPVEDLPEELISSLRGKRYLIILDDVWTTELWNDLKDVLLDSKNASRVIITSRLLDVANEADCNTEPHELRYLNGDESLTLLFRKAFQKHIEPQNDCPALLDVGRRLTNKCGGLPLALVVLGGILSRRKPAIFNTWDKVEQTMNWHNEDGKRCMKILAMSYEDLPYNLKPFFLYFACFPQVYKISGNHVTKMWVAEGLVQKEGAETMEERAEYFLQQLVQRCLIKVTQKSWNSYCKYCSMHDLLRNLAIHEAKEEKFFTVFSKAENIKQLVTRKPRRAALQFCTLTENGVYSENTRSLLCFGINEMASVDSGFGLLNYSRFRLLRVLTIEHVDTTRFDCKQWQKGLLHLRYLGLRYCNIRQEIFKEISLYNLETIDLKGSIILSPIVQENRNKSHVEIQTLRHVHGCKKFKQIFPLKWDEHTNLQTLKGVEQGEVPKLGSCTNLRTLEILYPYVIPDEREFCPQREWETLKGVLRKTEQLVSLGIIVAPEQGYSLPFGGTNGLACHERIQNLHITGEWVRNICVPSFDIFPTNLTKLVLELTGLNENPMPIFEQLQSLRILRLGPSSYIGRELSCSTRGFRNLKILELRELPMLSHWDIEVGAMPILRHLKIQNCVELDTLPELLELRTLQREVIENGYILELVNDPLLELEQRMQGENRGSGRSPTFVRKQPAGRQSLILDFQHFSIIFIVFPLLLIIASIMLSRVILQ